MFGNHGLCGLLEEGAHEKSPKCLGGNLGDFGEFCKGLLVSGSLKAETGRSGSLKGRLVRQNASKQAKITPFRLPYPAGGRKKSPLSSFLITKTGYTRLGLNFTHGKSGRGQSYRFTKISFWLLCLPVSAALGLCLLLFPPHRAFQACPVCRAVRLGGEHCVPPRLL